MQKKIDVNREEKSSISIGINKGIISSEAKETGINLQKTLSYEEGIVESLLLNPNITNEDREIVKRINPAIIKTLMSIGDISSLDFKGYQHVIGRINLETLKKAIELGFNKIDLLIKILHRLDCAPENFEFLINHKIINIDNGSIKIKNFPIYANIKTLKLISSLDFDPKSFDYPFYLHKFIQNVDPNVLELIMSFKISSLEDLYGLQSDLNLENIKFLMKSGIIKNYQDLKKCEFLSNYSKIKNIEILVCAGIKDIKKLNEYRVIIKEAKPDNLKILIGAGIYSFDDKHDLLPILKYGDTENLKSIIVPGLTISDLKLFEDYIRNSISILVDSGIVKDANDLRDLERIIKFCYPDNLRILLKCFIKNSDDLKKLENIARTSDNLNLKIIISAGIKDPDDLFKLENIIINGDSDILKEIISSGITDSDGLNELYYIIISKDAYRKDPLYVKKCIKEFNNQNRLIDNV